MHYAHSTDSPDFADWQPLAEHLANVAHRAAGFAQGFGAGKAAALAGRLHDLGKYNPAFQAYIKGVGPGVGHADAGARQVLALDAGPADRLVAELLAYAIAGHHGGLPDRQGPGGLGDRLKAQPAALDPAWRTELALDGAGLLPQGFNFRSTPAERSAQLAFLGRMIFSCLVDADFLDTEAFYAARDGRTVDRTWPALADRVADLVARFDAHMAGRRATAADTPLNRLRAEILAHARGKAALAPGVFTLDVPTGGGKTLTSLAFALEHARRWGMERIVYALPFTAIIDQTASIFQAVLGPDIVLEHHSAIEERAAGSDEQRQIRDGASDARLRLAMENWAAPVVVTTNVQLFESLHANRASRCRKLHNLAKAVIVLDEAQTIPLPVLRPCVAALDELARNYGSSIVLCTATQPALAAPRFRGGFAPGPGRELAPDPAGLHAALRRVTLRLAGELTDEALLDEIAGTKRALVVVNSRRHALALFRAGQAAGLDGLVHLSTRQTASDRRHILADVRQRLAEERPCLLIATSLVEAGVDLDFPRVWRAEAGLDQIAQAAGRCNREGRRPVEASIVTVFRPAQAQPPSELKAFAAAAGRVAARHGNDLLSPQALHAYFTEVYWQQGEGLDRHGVGGAFVVGLDGTDFPYRMVAEKFRLIESGQEPVIVAAEAQAREVLDALRHGMPAALAARRLQGHVVQVRPRDRDALIANRHVVFVEGFADQFAELRTASLYTPEVGLQWERADELGWDGIV